MVKIQVNLKNGDVITAETTSREEDFLNVFQAQSVQNNHFFAFQTFVVDFEEILSITLKRI